MCPVLYSITNMRSVNNAPPLKLSATDKATVTTGETPNT